MALWSIALLLVSVSIFAYRHPPNKWEGLPLWLHPGTRRGKKNSQHNASGAPTSLREENERARSTDMKANLEEHSGLGKTLKANGSEGNQNVPTFSLNEDAVLQEEQAVPAKSQSSVPSFPATNSAQRASAMAPPPKPMATPLTRDSASLLPTPRRTTIPPPGSANALRVPSNGPLPNRGLPANSQQRVNGGLTVNGAVSTPNPRGKVLLSPGHSPMDWAALTRKGNLSGVDTFQRVTPSMLKSMTGRKGKPAWSSWQGKVYNITPYLPFHPGGEPEIMKAAGRDGAKLFMEVHPWVNWENMLGSCLVGVMVPENYGMGGEGRSSLEDMD